MLIPFFQALRKAKIPVSVREFLTLLEALQAQVVGPATERASLDDFYFLARTCLVKDERHYDKFDQAFGLYFKGVEHVGEILKEIPEDWLKQTFEKFLTPEEKAKLEAMG